MHPNTKKGLMAWAKKNDTYEITKHLEGHDIEDPKALAVWLRKNALGEKVFKEHQEAGRKKAANKQ